MISATLVKIALGTAVRGSFVSSAIAAEFSHPMNRARLRRLPTAAYSPPWSSTSR